MVGLIKKEFRDSYKIFIPIIVLTVTLMIIVGTSQIIESRRMMTQNWEDLGRTYNVIFTLIITIGATLIVSSLISVIRYLYQNIYNDKGYELFTLPVSSVQIIISKIVIVLFWLAVFIITYYGLLLFFEQFLRSKYLSERIGYTLEFMFAPGSKLLVLRSFFNTFLTVLVGISTLLFAGAFANSKYVQSAKSIVTFIIVIIIVLIFLNVDSVIKGMGYTPSMSNTMSLSNYFISTFGFSMVERIVNLLLLFRLTLISILLPSTCYLWKNKLQF